MKSKDAWCELCAVLEPRTARGWRQEVEESSPPMWCFGLGGTARLVADIHKQNPRPFHLFLYDLDRDIFFETAEELVVELPDHEERNRGLTELQVGFLDSRTELTGEFLDELQSELRLQDQAFEN